MTRKFKKGIALFLTILMVVTMWTVPVYAEGTLDVIFDGINVTVKSGTVGDNAASYGEDYTVTLEVAENYQIYYMNVYCYGEAEYSNISSYTFDDDTGVLTIPKAEIDGYGEGLQEIHIEVYAMREYNADTELKKIDSLPYSDEFVIEEKNTIGIGLGDGVFTSAMKLYEVDLTEGQQIIYKAVGTDSNDVDLRIYLAKKTEQENIFEDIDYVDSDNIGLGEMGIFEVPETDRYVFIVAPFDFQYDEAVTFELIKFTGYVEELDFTQESAPVPGEDDLWAWDADTKTLTLKDGISISAIGCAIIVPDGATINVEGNVDIEAFGDCDAICCMGDVEINLSKGATLELSGYSGIYTPSGTVSINGEVSDEDYPELITNASRSGIFIYDDGHNTVIDGKTNVLNINSVKLDMTGAGGIELYEGDVNINDSDVIIDVVDEGIYLDYYSAVPTEECTITIKDSLVNLISESEVIQNYIGGVIIIDSDTMIISEGEEGIDAYGDIYIEGGRIDIDTTENCLETDEGQIELKDTNFIFHFNGSDGDYDIINAKKLLVDKEFIVYDKNMNVLYEGEMTDELNEMFENTYAFDFVDENGEHIHPKVVVSKFIGGTEENAVEGIEEEYEVTDTLEFIVTSEGMDISNPVWGYTRFMAKTWEILDTDLSGVVDENINSIDISSLEEGTYTLRVRFEKQICQRDYWSFYTNASDDKIDYVEIQFKVLGVSEEVTPPPAEDDDKEEIPPAEDNKQENDKTPDTGAENYGFITVIVALLGVMVVAVKKNKKTAK